MKRKILALLVALLLAALLPSCEEDSGKTNTSSSGKTETSSQEEEGFTAADAYDLYNEAIVHLMEADAYDISLEADVEIGGSTMAITMNRQFADDGETCTYYGHEDMAGISTVDTYYGDGLLTVIRDSMLAAGPTAEQTDMDRETFLAENNMSPNIGGIDIPEDSFYDADILLADGNVEVTVEYRDITEVPAEMESYVSMLVDMDTVTDLSYADTTIRLTMTEEGELKSIWIKSGLSYTAETGDPVAMAVDALISVNATNEEVTVTPLTESRLPDESEQTGEGEGNTPEFDLESILGGGGSFEIPDEYKDMIPEEYLDYLN